MQVKIESHLHETKEAFEAAAARALERCGSQAEGYAKDLCPGPESSGNLKNSIGHLVDTQQKKSYVGTRVRYAIYVEMGTGIHYPGGRKTPWRYKDTEGKWHTTRGQEAQPFIKPAVADHAQTYRNIINDEMRGK